MRCLRHNAGFTPCATFAACRRSEALYKEAIQSLQALADPERLRIAGLIADRALTTAEIATELELPTEAVTVHLALLGRGGLITTTKDRHERRMRLRAERLVEIDAWCAVQLESGLGEARPDGSVTLNVRQFFRGKRLVSYPAKQSLKLEVLSVLLADFARDTDYPEADVNEIIYRRGGDYAALRRDLVDFGLMTRDRGVYRRLK